MKHAIKLLCSICLMSGCCCNCSVQKEPTPLPQETAPVSVAQTAPEDKAAPLEPTPAPLQATTATKPVTETKPAQTAPAPKPAVVANTVSAHQTTDTPKSQSLSQMPVSDTPTKPVAPAKPVPDKAVFKDEPLIDLNGRLLNPLAAQVPTSDAAQSVAWRAEQLKYGIYYSFVKAGTAYIKNRGLISVDGRPAYVIQTSAFSASVIDSVFKVRDINLSWLDARDFHSLGYSQSLREGKYKRDEWVRFDYPKKEYYGQVKKKAEPRSFSGELTQPVLDMLTSLYYVRSKTLEPGEEVVFDIVNREEKYPLVVKVLKKETVKTDAGKFKCIVVEPQFRGAGIFVSKGKDLKVWLTDDEYKMPVKMTVEVFIGSVSAELLDYKRN